MVGICSCFRAEEEVAVSWIEYYRQLGVHIFYLYAHDWHDGTVALLQPYVDEGLVIIHLQDSEGLDLRFDAQMRAFSSCFAMYRYDVEWLAFLDFDEYIALPTPQSLPAYLDLRKHLLAIQMIEVFMSPNQATDSNEALLFPFGQHTLRLDNYASHHDPFHRQFKTLLHTGHPQFAQHAALVELSSHPDVHNPFYHVPWLSGVQTSFDSTCAVWSRIGSRPCPVRFRQQFDLRLFHYDTGNCQHYIRKRGPNWSNWVSTAKNQSAAEQSGWKEVFDWRFFRASPMFCLMRSMSKATPELLAHRRSSRVIESIMLRSILRPWPRDPPQANLTIYGELSSPHHLLDLVSVKAKLQVQRVLGSLSQRILILGTDHLSEIILSLNKQGSTSVVVLGEDLRQWISPHRRDFGNLVQIARKASIAGAPACWQLSESILSNHYQSIFLQERAMGNLPFCALPQHDRLIRNLDLLETAGVSLPAYDHPIVLPPAKVETTASFETRRILVVVDTLSPINNPHLSRFVESLLVLGHRVAILFNKLEQSASPAEFVGWRTQFGSRVEHFSPLREEHDLNTPFGDHAEAAYLLGVPLKSYQTLLRLAGGKAAENRFGSQLSSNFFNIHLIVPLIMPDFVASEFLHKFIYQVKYQHYFPGTRLAPFILNEQVYSDGSEFSWVKRSFSDGFFSLNSMAAVSSWVIDLSTPHHEKLSTAIDTFVTIKPSLIQPEHHRDFKPCQLRQPKPHDITSVPQHIILVDLMYAHMRLDISTLGGVNLSLIKLQMPGVSDHVLMPSELFFGQSSTDEIYIPLPPLLVSFMNYIQPDQFVEICTDVIAADFEVISSCCTVIQHPASDLYGPNLLPPAEPAPASLDTSMLDSVFEMHSVSMIALQNIGFQSWRNDSVAQRKYPLYLKNQHQFLDFVALDPLLEPVIQADKSWRDSVVILRSTEETQESTILLNPYLWLDDADAEDPSQNVILRVDGVIRFQNDKMVARILDHKIEYDNRYGLSHEQLERLSMSSPLLTKEFMIPAFNFSYSLLIKGLPEALEGLRYYLPTAAPYTHDIYDFWQVEGIESPVPISLSYLARFHPSCAHLIWAARVHGITVSKAPDNQIPQVVMPVLTNLDDGDVNFWDPKEFECAIPWKLLSPERMN